MKARKKLLKRLRKDIKLAHKVALLEQRVEDLERRMDASCLAREMRELAEDSARELSTLDFSNTAGASSNPQLGITSVL
jgi:hypothetical protein